MANTAAQWSDKDELGTWGNDSYVLDQDVENEHSSEDCSSEGDSSLERDENHVDGVCSGEGSDNSDASEEEDIVLSPELQRIRGMAVLQV